MLSSLRNMRKNHRKSNARAPAHMRDERKSLILPVFFMSLVVGLIFFVPIFYGFVVVGARTGFLPLVLFQSPTDSESHKIVLWLIVSFVGSASLSALPAWALYRYAMK